MPHQTDVGDQPVIHLTQVAGDLVLNGRPGTQLVAIGSGIDIVDIHPESGVVRIASNDDCVLEVPAGAVMHIGRVHGDAQINGVDGALHVQEIQGDLSINNVGPTSIQSVDGDVSANNIHGDLTIVAVEGDASINRVHGACRLTGVRDDLSLSAVEGDVEANVGDDASIRLALRHGVRVQVRAGSDLTCRIPTDSSARVALQAGAGIHIRRLPLPPEQSKHSFTLGAGEAELDLSAGDELSLLGSDTTWDPAGAMGSELAVEMSLRAGEFAQQIASQVETQVSNITRQLDEKLSQLAEDQELATRIQEKVQAAMRTAEVKIAEAMRTADERARKAEQRAATRGKSQSWSWSSATGAQPQSPPKQPRPPLSDEERMAVLRMVDDGKISVEQAEQLLAALRAKGQK